MIKMEFMEEKGPNAFLHYKERLKLCRYTIRHNYKQTIRRWYKWYSGGKSCPVCHFRVILAEKGQGESQSAWLFEF